MFHDVLALGLIAPFLLAAVAARGDDPPTAATILEGTDRALGDRSTRSALSGLIFEGTVGTEGMSGGKVREAYHGDGRVLVTTSFPGYDAMTMGATPAMCWTTDPALGVAIKEGDDAAPVRRFFAFCRLAPWRTIYARAENQGAVEIEGRPHWELRMVTGAGQSDTWFIDRESHLPTAVDVAFPDPTGGTLAMRYVFGDWKQVDGLLVPHRRRQLVGGMEIDYRFEEVRVGAAVADDDVAPPEAVLAAAEDPARRTPSPPEAGDACSIVTTELQHTATIRTEVAADQISASLATILPEVFMTLAGAGTSMAGPPFSRYHSQPQDGAIDVEAGIPVRAKIAGKGRVTASTLPAGRAAMTWHVGPYHELRKAYERLERWMKEQGLIAAGGPWEIYWTDPGLEPDPSKWRTQIFWPIQSGDDRARDGG